MKTRIILLGVALAAFIAVIVSLPSHEVSSDFSPRSIKNVSQGYSGAAEHYEMLRRNNVSGVVEDMDAVRMQKAVRQHAKDSRSLNKDLGVDLTWLSMGPNNYGGRTRDICITAGGSVFAGGVSGGLFRSWDYGNTWFKVTGFDGNVNVTTIEEAGDGTLYLGTGSSFDFAGGFGGSGFIGDGVYKSTDGGNSWEQVEIMSCNALQTNCDWTSVNRIVADKANQYGIYLAYRGGIAYYENNPGQGTEELTTDFDGFSNLGTGQDVAMSADGQTIVVGVSGRVHVSNNGGQTWTSVSGSGNGEIASGGISRVGVTVSQEDPDYMYALLSAGGRMGGVYASTNGGSTWSEIWPANDVNNSNIEIDPFGENTQGNYDLAISVFPNDKEKVIVGGVTLWQGGLNIQPERIAFNFGFGPNYVHSDIHHLEWFENELYIGCDGGVFRSNNVAFSDEPIFVDSNFGYKTTQFYGIGISTTGKVNGGTQDQSTFLMNSVSQNAINQFGGDGFDSDISAVSDNAQFATSQFGSLGRSFDGGNSFSSFYDSELATLQQLEGQNFPFHTLVRLHENTDNPASQQEMIFIANEDTIPAGETITFLTNNLNLPVEYELEEPLYIRPEVDVLQEQITEVEDSLITETFVFTEEEYTDPDFEFEVTVTYGITDIVINLPDPTIILSEDTLDGMVTVVVEFTEDVELSEIVEVTLFDVPDTLSIVDPYTSLFAVFSFQGIYVTRQALDANTTPVWTEIIDGNTQANCIEFSVDGNHMYIGSGSGDLTRVSGFNNFWGPEDIGNLTTTRIFRSGGNTITGIGIDPNDPDRIAISLGEYGGNAKVWITDIATTAEQTTSTEHFDDIWFTSGDLRGMPCYDVCILDNNATSDDIIVVATEFGVYATDDIGNNNSWVPCNQNIDNVPVFAIRQQYRGPERFIENPTNTGVVYIGTHGKGVYRSGGVVSVEEADSAIDSGEENLLKLFPNPASGMVNLEINLDNNENISVEIYNLSGAVVYSQNLGTLTRGQNILPIAFGNLSTGNYIVHVHGDQTDKVSKLLVK